MGFGILGLRNALCAFWVRTHARAVCEYIEREERSGDGEAGGRIRQLGWECKGVIGALVLNRRKPVEEGRGP